MHLNMSGVHLARVLGSGARVLAASHARCTFVHQKCMLWHGDLTDAVGKEARHRVQDAFWRIDMYALAWWPDRCTV